MTINKVNKYTSISEKRLSIKKWFLKTRSHGVCLGLIMLRLTLKLTLMENHGLTQRLSEPFCYHWTLFLFLHSIHNTLSDSNFHPKFNQLDDNVDRQSYEGVYEVKDGYPLNPLGRTGIRLRGRLGRWG